MRKAVCAGCCDRECAESALKDLQLARMDKTLQGQEAQEKHRVSAIGIKGCRDLTQLGTQREHCQGADLLLGPRMVKKQPHGCSSWGHHKNS